MEYFIVCLVALIASGLTLFSGFGLGTILMPALALFFPVPIAVAATAIVHLANNLFKLLLVGRSANRSIVLRFGVPAVLAAFAGASLLNLVAAVPVIAAYDLNGQPHQITIVNLVIGLLIVFFAGLELSPKFAKVTVDQKYLALGGLLSGFFGGLSGNQGAFRSMFLIKSGLNKDEFIATNVVIAVMVDVARLLIYSFGLYAAHAAALGEHRGLVLAATVAAFIGAFLGKELIKKVTLRAVQIIVGVMLVLLGILLSVGLI